MPTPDRNILMRTILSLCAAIAALTLAGCGGTSYVGKWDAAVTSTDPQAAAVMGQMGTMKNAFELKSDETYVFDFMGQKMEGTYKVEGKTLTMTPKDGSGSMGTLTASEDG